MCKNGDSPSFDCLDTAAPQKFFSKPFVKLIFLSSIIHKKRSVFHRYFSQKSVNVLRVSRNGRYVGVRCKGYRLEDSAPGSDPPDPRKVQERGRARGRGTPPPKCHCWETYFLQIAVVALELEFVTMRKPSKRIALAADAVVNPRVLTIICE